MAAGRDIGVAVTGDGNQVHLTPPVRSAYWEQVRRIAPPELVGRESELTELAAFCCADSGPAYAWWRAGAWAGKTALLAWFALRPPTGVRIVPFFVTARLGAQNDVTAYVDVVLEQLAELAGETLPAHLTDATREAHLLHLYGAAARACAARGERLVLLVDGLDEDRGVTTGPDAHSIASLLPARPDPPMRVLVAGRLDPPLPGDVPAGHPLHDPATVRTLAPSPYAQAVRTEAERELKQLIAAGGLEHDLLALVTAAGGGLTAADLTALTGAVPYRVQDTLRTRAGRTFAARAGEYLLGHEELQRQAVEMLGEEELGRCRERLHGWADAWRERGWPEETPRYLLHGYFRMLRARKDLPRLVACVVDLSRHERMLQVTGGDAAALAEIRAAEDLVAEAGVPDLRDVFRLALRREELENRNDFMTRVVPWAWAALGRFERAGALARSIPSLDWRALALADISGEHAARGERAKAAELLVEAEGWAFDDRFALGDERDQALADIGRGWTLIGRLDRAERLLSVVLDREVRAELLSDLARPHAESGDFDRAEALCRQETDEWTRAVGLAAVAVVAAIRGLLDRARALAASAAGGRALVLARVAWALHRSGRPREARDVLAGPDADQVGPMFLPDVVEALAESGECERALALIREAGPDADTDQSLRWVVRALTAAGDEARARDLAERIEDPQTREQLPVDLVAGLAAAGDYRRALATAEGIKHAFHRAMAMNALVDALISAGRTERAEHLALNAGDVDAGLHPVGRVIEAWARLGELDRARRLAHDADTLHAHDALVRGAVAAAGSGRASADAVEAVVSETQGRIRGSRRGGSLHPTHVAQSLAAEGFLDEARSALTLAEREVPRPGPDEQPAMTVTWQVETGRLAEALSWAGCFDAAEELVRRLEDSPAGTFARFTLNERLCAAGEFDRAEALAAAVEPSLGDVLRDEIVVSAADAGDTARARALADGTADPKRRASAWARTAAALARAGDHPAAREALDTALSNQHRSDSFTALPEILHAQFTLGLCTDGDALLSRWEDAGQPLSGVHGQVVHALVRAGEHERAVRFVDRLAAERPHRDARKALVRALAEAGRAAMADEQARIAETAQMPDRDRVQIWLALAPVVPAPRGRKLLARAVRHETLGECLRTLVRLDPGVVPLVTEALHAARAPLSPEPGAPARTSGRPAS